MKFSRLMCCMIAVTAYACGEPGELTPNQQENDNNTDGNFALIDGVPTQARPEIGSLFFGRGLCTATLIGPRVAITARHCVGYTTCDDEVCASLYNPRVTFENPTLGAQTYRVVAFESYDQNGVVPQDFLSEQINYLNFERHDYWLSDDVAVMLLERDVPESVAKPAPLLDREAQRGESLTIWGYGCTERETRTGSQTKRYYDFVEGNRSNNLCPGDSGGPVTLGRNGAVRYVNSAYTIELNSRDVFGDVLYFRRQIDARLKAWGQQSPGPINTQPDPVEPQDPQQPPEQPKFTWVGDECASDSACNFASGNEIGMCTRAANRQTGVCTLGCEGYCPDVAGTAPTFCVSLDGGRTGSCVSKADKLNNFCNNSGLTTAQKMNRFVGFSGARNASATVCVPFVAATPEPPTNQPPQTLEVPRILNHASSVFTPNVDISWTNVANAKSYTVDLFYYNRRSQQWQTYHSWKTNKTSFTAWPVLSKTSYYYSVTACHDTVCSTPSSPQSFYFEPR